MPKKREIAQLGNPVLRDQAKVVTDFDSDAVKQIVDDMLFTLSQTNGVGIAAPQISESLCIVIIASRPTARYPSAPEMEPVVMFNPKFSAINNELEKDWEGCLSIPGIRALVPRYKAIYVEYHNADGETCELQLGGFVARVFQHEYDHLQGLVYLDRVENNRNIISETEFLKLFNDLGTRME
jgi:peptide deformylase